MNYQFRPKEIPGQNFSYDLGENYELQMGWFGPSSAEMLKRTKLNEDSFDSTPCPYSNLFIVQTKTDYLPSSFTVISGKGKGGEQYQWEKELTQRGYRIPGELVDLRGVKTLPQDSDSFYNVIGKKILEILRTNI